MKKVVGYITIDDSNNVYRRQFETAAWYELHEIQKGRFPVYSVPTFGSNDRVNYTAELPSVILSDYFQSSFYGNAFGEKYDSSQNAGKKSVVIVSESPGYAWGFEQFVTKWKFQPVQSVKEVGQ